MILAVVLHVFIDSFPFALISKIELGENNLSISVNVMSLKITPEGVTCYHLVFAL